ncbi:hypothetical protein PGT21_034668 [Puccinia graminis f. sp. tritici]|nr:hypothetical protein PGT21_034668 [Puccinia graminis f. sp. tritici]
MTGSVWTPGSREALAGSRGRLVSCTRGGGPDPVCRQEEEDFEDDEEDKDEVEDTDEDKEGNEDMDDDEDNSVRISLATW